MTRKQIKKRLEEIKKKYQLARLEELKLQTACPHADLTYVYLGSTGNYDPSADSTWIDWKCSDCEKQWRTPQGREFLTKYPHAVDKTYSR